MKSGPSGTTSATRSPLWSPSARRWAARRRISMPSSWKLRTRSAPGPFPFTNVKPRSCTPSQAAIASTIPIMGAPCKGSRWRPSSHDFSAPALGWGAGAARRLAIAVHAVLSRRAFVVVAALERGVHVFADAARADETLGAVRGVAALRRDAALADAGVGAACGSEQEQERESHGSPVLPDARGAVSVTWRRRFHRGSSRATLLRGEGARTNTPTIPARNPPTCAHQATPPVPSGTFSE